MSAWLTQPRCSIIVAGSGIDGTRTFTRRGPRSATNSRETIHRIETSDPPIQALGITDYCSIDAYEQVLDFRAKGRVSGVQLIFPNVELRFGIETARGARINVHLPFSPENPDHPDLIRRFLSEFSLQFQRETYHCNAHDLLRPARAFNKPIKDDRKALQEGASQFKVNVDELRDDPQVSIQVDEGRHMQKWEDQIRC